MTSPSSNFVFVDKSCSVNATPVLKSAQHTAYIPQQQAAIRNRSAIVNEHEYLSATGENVLTAANVNYVKASDLLNSAQVIQFVSDEQAALIQQYQPTIVERSPEKVVRPTISSAQVNSKTHAKLVSTAKFTLMFLLSCDRCFPHQD